MHVVFHVALPWCSQPVGAMQHGADGTVMGAAQRLVHYPTLISPAIFSIAYRLLRLLPSIGYIEFGVRLLSSKLRHSDSIFYHLS